MVHKNSNKFIKDIKMNKYLYIMAIPIIAFYIIFQYIPMYGIIIAFKDFSPHLGIFKSPWVGFEHFVDFFTSIYFTRTLKNTFLLSLQDIIFGFPAPIILALLLNEINYKKFKKAVQSISYIPHFVSLVVICGIILDFSTSDGIICDFLAMFGFERTNLMAKPEYFRTIYISSGIWQSIGWGSIIYLAAITNIDPSLYEASIIDGANRWQQLKAITLPSIAPTIIILLILRIGSLMSVGFEKIILLYNPMTYETADVISSYVYRRGMIDLDFSFSTAVGIFNSLINFTLLVTANKISKKVTEISFW